MSTKVIYLTWRNRRRRMYWEWVSILYFSFFFHEDNLSLLWYSRCSLFKITMWPLADWSCFRFDFI